jgi:hypothetical protein
MRSVALVPPMISTASMTAGAEPEFRIGMTDPMRLAGNISPPLGRL